MHVLLPVDSNEERAEAAASAVTELPNAADAVQVTILNVYKEFDVSSEEGRFSSADHFDADRFPDSVGKVEVLLRDAGIEAEKRRLHADPAEAIITTANEIGADLIVMAGHRRTPVGKVLFGSVTQSVLLDAGVPVTVVPIE